MRRQHHHPRIMKTYQLNCCSVTVSPFPFVWDCTNEILASRSPLLYDKGNGQRDVCSHSYFLLLCCEDWCPFSCRITLKADSWDKTVEKKRCEKQRNLLRKDEKNTLQNGFAMTSHWLRRRISMTVHPLLSSILMKRRQSQESASPSRNRLSSNGSSTTRRDVQLQQDFIIDVEGETKKRQSNRLRFLRRSTFDLNWFSSLFFSPSVHFDLLLHNKTVLLNAKTKNHLLLRRLLSENLCETSLFYRHGDRSRESW